MIKRHHRVLACIVAIVMLGACLSGFSYAPGLGNIYHEASWDIFDGTTYTSYVTEHSTHGIERAYVVEADVVNTKLTPIIVTGEVHSTQTVGSLVNYYENQGYHVVAAINGDIYDTSTGTPKGTVIREGNIITSGYGPDRVWAFDKEGKASIRKVDLTYSAHGTIEYQWPVETKVVTTGSGVDVNGVPYEYPKEETETTYETYTKEVDLPIGFFNVPHGGANALHLYNRHYGSSTMTKGSNAEAVIRVDDIQLGVNKTIKGTVESVNKNTENTPITSNTMVLSTVLGSATYDRVCCLKPGTEITISVEETGEGQLNQVSDAIGFYYSIVENGSNSTSGNNINPRTAIGVKEDGTLVLTEVDGRTYMSKGITLPELSSFMRDLGCKDAVNLDGGGSSVIYVRKAGFENKVGRISTPSGNSERKISNAILLVYKNQSSSSAAHLHIGKSMQLVMPGASVSLSAAASNELYEQAKLPGEVTYSVSEGSGTISGNYYTAGEKTGKIEIKASSNGINGSTFVTVVDDIIIKPSVTKLSLAAGAVKDLSVSAAYGTSSVNVPVSTNDSIFKWSCDSAIGTVTNEGVFTATSGAAKNGYIYIEFGGKTAKIEVKVGADIKNFTDTTDHWAKTYIGVLAGQNYLNGMGENMFQPDGQLTRAQFVAMLKKIDSGINTDTATSGDTASGEYISGTPESSDNPAESISFKDVPDSEWFAPYVKWATSKGIASGMGDGTFAPNAPITREQMSVMLCKYSASVNFMLPNKQPVPNFSDTASISSWSREYVNTAARAGIINGFDTGEFAPQGQATRAQAATIIYKFAELYGLI